MPGPSLSGSVKGQIPSAIHHIRPGQELELPLSACNGGGRLNVSILRPDAAMRYSSKALVFHIVIQRIGQGINHGLQW